MVCEHKNNATIDCKIYFFQKGGASYNFPIVILSILTTACAVSKRCFQVEVPIMVVPIGSGTRGIRNNPSGSFNWKHYYGYQKWHWIAVPTACDIYLHTKSLTRLKMQGSKYYVYGWQWNNIYLYRVSLSQGICLDEW